MIQIRTITYNLENAPLFSYSEKIKDAKNLWANFKYKSRTQRISLPIVSNIDIEHIDKLNEFCSEVGIRWFNIPFDYVKDRRDYSDLIANILFKYRHAFCNMICVKDKVVDVTAIEHVSKTIKQTALMTDDGCLNFNLGASINIKPNCPFFPFTYSNGEKLSFTIGLELAEEINHIFNIYRNQKNLSELRDLLLARIMPQVDEIEKYASYVSEISGIEFGGIDFSLAPLPNDSSSVITILEAMGIHEFGGEGILFATAYLTDILKYLAASYKSVGFNGVMYSLLEDRRFGQINDAQGTTIEQMISLSTMCGCGVDMVPVSYEIAQNCLKTIIIETACVSSRLNKALGVRILPVRANNEGKTFISSDKDFICNTKLVSVSSNAILSVGEKFQWLKNIHNLKY